MSIARKRREFAASQIVDDRLLPVKKRHCNLILNVAPNRWKIILSGREPPSFSCNALTG